MKVINMLAGPGAGKCFRKGTRVMMFGGSTKPVEQVKVGDQLMGPDSEPRTVVNLSTGRAPMYEVKPTKGDAHYVTGNHVLPLKMNHHGVEKDETYTVSEFLRLSPWRKERLKIYRADFVEFDEAHTPVDPYFIGLWLGDGTNANQSVTTIDEPIKNYLAVFARKYGCEAKHVTKQGTDAVRVDLSIGQQGGSPNPILNKLRELELLNNKHIPHIYKINSTYNRLCLLAGLIDSDGHHTNNCVDFVSKYKRLSEDVEWLCRSLGLAAYTSEKIVNDTVYYRTSISGELKDVPTLLMRKQFTPREQCKSVLRTGITVTPVGMEEFFGFEVTGDHLFLLADFTVTHNSTTAAGLFHLMKLKGYSVELVTEYAKEVTWDGHMNILEDQIYVFAKQQRRMARLRGQVAWIVTDSPLLFSNMYASDQYPQAFYDLVMHEFRRYENYNFFIERKKEYVTAGRNQSFDEARAVDERVRNLLNDEDIPYVTVDGTPKAPEQILHMLDYDFEKLARGAEQLKVKGDLP